MTLHLTGEGFSELHHVIFSRGRRTRITMHARTTGSPEFKYTALELHDGDATLDVLKLKPKKKRGALTKAWIRQRLALRRKRPPPRPTKRRHAQRA